ncbi:MAG TPA: packaged DNA stabilization protein [Thiobacillus sp.]
MARSPIALGLASGRSRPLNAGRLVNLYAEQAAAGSITQWVLYGTPGQKTFATVGSGTIRAGREALGYAYVLSGQSVYRVDSSGNSLICTGDTPVATGTAMMTDNGVQVGMLVGTDVFYITGTTVTKVTDADFPATGALSIDYIDGFGVLNTNATTGQWFLSGLLDFSTYAALDFATAESSPDGLLRVLANHKEVWLFGSKSIEVWTDTGSTPFPFTQIPGSLMDRGIGASLSAILMDNSVFWLGNDRIIYRANGYQPMRISTHAVEEVLRSGTVSDAFAMTHVIGGHHFYVLTLPTLARTLCFDAATQLWHERQYGTDVSNAAWNVNCIFTAFGKTLAGTMAGGVYELDLDTYLDGTTQIRRAVTSMPLYPNGNRGILKEVEMECELGVGLNTGQGSSPQAMLRMSKDGGRTFGNYKTATLGATGITRNRAHWHQLGMFRDGVVELSIADPVKVAIYGANYELEQLVN